MTWVDRTQNFDSASRTEPGSDAFGWKLILSRGTERCKPPKKVDTDWHWLTMLEFMTIPRVTSTNGSFRRREAVKTICEALTAQLGFQRQSMQNQAEHVEALWESFLRRYQDPKHAMEAAVGWEIWRSCSHAVYELMIVDWFVGLPWFSGANIFKNWSGRNFLSEVVRKKDEYTFSVSFQSLYRLCRSWCYGIHLCLASGIVWSVATHPTFLARKGLGAISQALDAGNAGVSVVEPVGLRLKLDTSSHSLDTSWTSKFGFLCNVVVLKEANAYGRPGVSSSSWCLLVAWRKGVQSYNICAWHVA